MCGISLIIDPEDRVPADAIGRMVSAVRHRGPDGCRTQRLAGCHLGHARLSIIDLEGGTQPMTEGSGRYSITFNGEIYNYREVRRRLEHEGAQFHTASDTEVILVGFGRWGARVLNELRGMFAFAIWDAQERTLFAARDLFGEKPLYYGRLQDGGLVLASEITAIIKSGLIVPKIDRAAIDAYLALGYVPPVRTVYTNISTLPPGCSLRWGGGRVTIERYWAPQLDPIAIEMPEAAAEVRRLLRQAVERQMVADVPVGAFLSGGLDSTTIVALMQAGRSEPIKTFSVGFGSQINELPFARAVADRYGTEHHEVDLGEPEVGALLERMATVYDEPFADSSNIPTFVISEFARRSVKVVLSGDGGDELFGGYSRYISLAASERIRGSVIEWITLRALSRLVRERIGSLHRRSVAVGLASRWPDLAVRCAMSQVNMRAPQRRVVWGGTIPYESEAPGTFVDLPDASVTGLNRALHFDLTCYLPGDILPKVDRAAMAHGLETRAPFLDRDLGEFVLRLPASMKVADYDLKVVFRAACADLWPDAVRQRRKQGFGVPYVRWLGRPDVAPIIARVFGPQGRLRSLLPGLSAGPPPRNSSTWALLTLGLWLEQHEYGW